VAILTRLGVPGTAEAWSSLAFDVVDGTVTVGRVLHALDEELSWSFDELHGDASGLGVPTSESPLATVAATHRNAIDRVDHVVYAVPDLDPAIDALTAVLGEPPRRRAKPRGPSGPEMAFWRCGDGSFIEVVASGQPASLWGIAFVSGDLDRTVEAIKAAGGPVGDPKPAVQGGRIASVWKGHVGWGIAIMEPPDGKTT
jgi:catechol 2,3-dioxygenase-like lactoylglutathione lyase family enzyme